MHLTNKGPIRSDALAASGRLDAAGAPVDEIEITPEMIEAGLEKLFDYDHGFSNENDIVAEIFRVMLSASASRCRREHP